MGIGCSCNNNVLMEAKIEVNQDYINNQLNNDNIKEKLISNPSMKEEEIDTTVGDYSEMALKIINQIRKDPKSYSNFIEESIKNIIIENDEVNPSLQKIIYKDQIRVALVRGEPAFIEAAEELRNIESMEPLEMREENCISLPDNIEDYRNNYYLKKQIKNKSKNNININIFYKENVSVPEISVLLMIVDDRNKTDSGKKRRAILNKDFKYIGITSKFIDDIFISYYTFSKK